MPNTPRMTWPYPGELSDPWFDAFLSFVEAADASAAACREDRNLLLFGGGTMSFDASSGVVSWSSGISVLAPTSGFLRTIPAGSLAVSAGEILYVSLARFPSDNTSVALSKASQVPNTDDALLIGVRVDGMAGGSAIFFRNGAVLRDGQSALILAGGATTLGSSGQKLRNDLALATGQSNSTSTFQVVGSLPIDPQDYVLSSTTTTFKFKTVASVSDSGLIGEVVLYNLTDGVTVSTLSYTETGSTKKLSGSLTLPASEKMYEVRIRLSSGTGSFVCQWAGFEIDRTL